MKLMLIFGFFSLMAFATVACSQIITSGSHKVSSGTTISGNLIMTSGTLEIEEGAVVKGSVFMTSGILDVNGHLNGNVLRTSGTINVGNQGVIQGSIRSLSGEVHKEKHGQILGSEVNGNGMLSFSKLFAIGGSTLIAIFFSWRHLFTGDMETVNPAKLKEKLK